MPTIESRKYPGNIHFVDAEAWEQMKRKGLSRRYNVIDNDDIKQTIIPTPVAMTDFEVPNEPINPIVVEKVLTREELKTALDELGVEYNTRTSTENLSKLLKESNND